MPLVGFGIWKVPREKTAQSVYDAIKMGYRHIDGAYDYTNSKEAGEGVQRAIADGLVRREDLFVTSKLWNNYHKKQHALEMAQHEVDTWGIGYLDLYLIHFPVSLAYIAPSELRWPCFWSDPEQKQVTAIDPTPVSETWAALESLVRTDANPSGILRSIGVANFSSQLLHDLLSYAAVKPAVLQVEHHPYLVQAGLIRAAQAAGVAVTAYSSFGPQSFVELGNATARDTQPLFSHQVVVDIAQRHGRTPAQVLLRWATQRDVIVIPKSNNAQRLAENLDSFSFDLAAEELEAISGLDKGLRFNNPAALGSLHIFD